MKKQSLGMTGKIRQKHKQKKAKNENDRNKLQKHEETKPRNDRENKAEA
jgi:hypothetical protein